MKEINKMQDQEITYTELYGSPGYAERPCPCGVEDCDCRERHEQEQEEIAEDERLGW